MQKFRIIGIIGANGMARLVDAVSTLHGVDHVKMHPFENAIEVSGDIAPIKVIAAAAKQGIEIDFVSRAS